MSRSSKRRDQEPRDAGYSLVEAAITLPVLIVLTMLVVQFALLWHGRHVAESAARDGLDAARGYEAPAGAGQDAALGFVSDVAPKLLQDPAVTVTRTNTTIRVSVRARVLRVIPFGDFAVSESVEGPIERVIAVPTALQGVGARSAAVIVGPSVTGL